MAERTYMDVRSRIATCLLLKKLDMNKAYSQKIGVQDTSHYENSASYDKRIIESWSKVIIASNHPRKE